ncbi:hypothetical protein [Streptomyces sp. B3I8]|uniref:hypothetical protein n=1 Tax=Streptomyces sp. B3I8 TaxID=3042303 RepID=UPI002782842E|nr:hypothetical protein [Streptomyces sp. B3I8]MDQ0791485.1 hypothetical protein [Streptomyces sp. B3I8]
MGSYKSELARSAEPRAAHGPAVPDGAATAGPRLVRLLHHVTTAHQPTWGPAQPLSGGEEQWRRVPHEVAVGTNRFPV